MGYQNQYKVTIYSEDEQVLGIYKMLNINIDQCFDEVVSKFSCDGNNMKKKNGRTYGYIGEFKCFGRFKIED